MTSTTSISTITAAFEAAAQLRALRLSIPSGDPETDQFHREALSFSEAFSVIERASQDLPSVAQYVERMDPLRLALEQKAAELAAAESNAIKALSQTEATGAASIAKLRTSLDALAAECADAQRRASDAVKARADAISDAAESGADLAAIGNRHNKAIKDASAAVENAEAARAAVAGRIESLARSLALAQAGAAAERRELGEKRRDVLTELAGLRADTAAGLYVISLAGLPADAVPDFELPVERADRVPLATGSTVDADTLRRFILARESAEDAADWLERLRASGLLGFRFSRPVVSAALFTRVGGVIRG
jgi:hypothetical protein